MNKIAMNALVAAILALGCVSSAAAQGIGWQGSLPIDEGRLTPGGAFYRKPMQWLQELNLSDAQQDQVYQIIYERAPAIREQMKAVRRAREELDKLASTDQFDAARAREVAEAGAKALVEIALLRAETTNRIREVLTPEQRARMDQLRTQRPR